MQGLLFPAPRALTPDVPGLRYLPDYLAPDEECTLLAKVDAAPWLTDWQRRRQVYGLGYGAGPAAFEPLPDWLLPLASRIAEDGLLERFPENCVINDYQPGQGIALHKDYPAFGPTVVALGLGAPVLFDLEEPRSRRRVSIDLAPRSCLVMGGPARSRWRHGIAARKTEVIEGQRRPRVRRVSITFRVSAGR